MSLIFITGISGSGKSAVCEELVRRGYEAHDTDENDLTAWHHKATGKVTERPEAESQRTKEWYEEHEWRMSRQKVEELAERANDKPIFLCGSPSNGDEMLDLFGDVICLTINKATLIDRLATRTTNDYGKAPDELKDILGWHESFEDRYKRYDAVMIDAEKPLSDVVDEVVQSQASV